MEKINKTLQKTHKIGKSLARFIKTNKNNKTKTERRQK